jgi:hypothetical protein
MTDIINLISNGYGFDVREIQYALQLRHEELPGYCWNWYYTTGSVTMCIPDAGCKKIMTSRDAEEVCLYIKKIINDKI